MVVMFSEWGHARRDIRRRFACKRPLVRGLTTILKPFFSSVL